MSRVVHFVVAVDLETGDKFIDDETFVAKFGFERVWNTETNKWEEEDWDKDYVPALEILNNSDWRAE